MNMLKRLWQWVWRVGRPRKAQSVKAHTNRYTLIYLSGPIEKGAPAEADVRLLLDWQEQGIVIPWPTGMTPKEAILDWANEACRGVGSNK